MPSLAPLATLPLLVQFLVFWACLHALTLAVYFGVAGALDRVNRRHPARRIQQRSGNHRIAKDIRASLRAQVVSTFMQSAGLFALWKGWTVVPPFGVGVWSVVLGFAALTVAYDAWFYFVHRLLHTKALYRFHASHHRALAPTAWSSDSSSVVDTAMTHLFLLIAPILLPAPIPVHIAHRLMDQVTGLIGHCGFEHFASPTSRWPWPMVCVLFHDQHHSSFRTNYGNTFSLWDRVLGTIHPEYDAHTQLLEQRMRDPSAAPVAVQPSRRRKTADEAA